MDYLKELKEKKIIADINLLNNWQKIANNKQLDSKSKNEHILWEAKKFKLYIYQII